MDEHLPTTLLVETTHEKRTFDHDHLKQLVQYLTEKENRSLRYLSVILADHETILELNQDFLEHDYFTDVISFPLGGEENEKTVEGEIYVDLDTAAERAPEFETTFAEEVRRYVIHGLLHLLGYTDKTEDGKALMRRLEDKYLAAVPYNE